MVKKDVYGAKIKYDPVCWNCGWFYIKGTNTPVKKSVWKIDGHYFCSQKCIDEFTGLRRRR